MTHFEHGSKTSLLDAYINPTLVMIDHNQFSIVYRVEYGPAFHRQTVILKSIKVGEESDMEPHPDCIERAQQEYAILKNFDHTNAIKAHNAEFNQNKTRFEILMEDWGEALTTFKAKNVHSTQIIEWFRQMVDVLDYGEQKKVYHGDLKPKNILIKDGRAKLIDFGVSKVLSDTKYANTLQTIKLIGHTPVYNAPELLKKKGPYFMNKMDVYSLGITFFELIENISIPNLKKYMIERVDQLEEEYKGFLQIIKKIELKSENQSKDYYNTSKFIPILISTLQFNPRARPPFSKLKILMDQFHHLSAAQIRKFLISGGTLEEIKEEAKNAQKDEIKFEDIPTQKAFPKHSFKQLSNLQNNIKSLIHINSERNKIIYYNPIDQRTEHILNPKRINIVPEDAVTIVTPSNRIFCLGGKSPSGKILKTVYSLVFDKFELLHESPMPKSKLYFGCVATNQEVICIGGIGQKFEYCKDCEELWFNEQSEYWRHLPPLSQPKMQCACCTFGQKWVYVYGGYIDSWKKPLLFSRYSRVVERMSLRNKNLWEQIQIPPQSEFQGCARSGACQISHNEIIIFAGIFEEELKLNKDDDIMDFEGKDKVGDYLINGYDAFYHNIETNTFVKDPNEGVFLPSCFVLSYLVKGKIFAFQEYDLEDASRLFICDIETKSWKSKEIKVALANRYEMS